jgi:hypothetical protein
MNTRPVSNDTTGKSFAGERLHSLFKPHYGAQKTRKQFLSSLGPGRVFAYDELAFDPFGATFFLSGGSGNLSRNFRVFLFH